MIKELAHGVKLTAENGEAIFVSTADSASHDAGDGAITTMDLLDARDLWDHLGGSEAEWHAAISYVDSLR